MAHMTTAAAPSREDLVRRAADLVPLLRKHAVWQEENRHLHEEVVEGLADAGVLRLRVPARFGGLEADTRTLNAVMAQIGRGDAAAAWTASVWSIPGWMAGLFPEPVLQEVFSTPDVRVCGTLSPSARAVPVNGGMVVDGTWNFISGALHSHWQEILAMAPGPDLEDHPVVALVPMSDLEIVDDWHVSGLRGSGSVTTVAKGVFVPQERILPLPTVLAGRAASPLNAASEMYRNPLVAVANASSAGTVLGMAEAAMEAFMDRVGERKITYTDYAHQRDAPITHIQVAEARLRIDRAWFHADRMTQHADAKAAAGESWTIEERARTRADIGSVCRLGKEAVDILSLASGGSSIYTHVPMQRIARDMQVINLHAINVPETNFELYGRVLCGLEPNTPYV